MHAIPSEKQIKALFTCKEFHNKLRNMAHSQHTQYCSGLEFKGLFVNMISFHIIPKTSLLLDHNHN